MHKALNYSIHCLVPLRVCTAIMHYLCLLFFSKSGNLVNEISKSHAYHCQTEAVCGDITLQDGSILPRKVCRLYLVQKSIDPVNLLRRIVDGESVRPLQVAIYDCPPSRSIQVGPLNLGVASPVTPEHVAGKKKESIS